jgi:hypothetical protein
MYNRSKRENVKMITKENLSNDLKEVSLELGKIPSGAEYTTYGRYGRNTVIRKFESWSEALKQTFPDYKESEKSQELKCVHCGKSIIVMPSNIKEKNYCSVSCSNKDKPRRSLTKNCKNCENLIVSTDTYCEKCFKRKMSDCSERTIGEFREKRKDATRYSYIRGNARVIMKKNNIEKKCKSCTYIKHVEVCHIKDICEFPDDTKIGVINDISNLVYLCRNCHWEFDNKLLVL